MIALNSNDIDIIFLRIYGSECIVDLHKLDCEMILLPKKGSRTGQIRDIVVLIRLS